MTTFIDSPGWDITCGAVGQESTATFRVQTSPSDKYESYSVILSLNWGDGKVENPTVENLRVGVAEQLTFQHTYTNTAVFEPLLGAKIVVAEGVFPNQASHTSKQRVEILSDSCSMDVVVSAANGTASADEKGDTTTASRSTQTSDAGEFYATAFTFGFAIMAAWRVIW
jgi:hypothetical protein